MIDSQLQRRYFLLVLIIPLMSLTSCTGLRQTIRDDKLARLNFEETEMARTEHSLNEIHASLSQDATLFIGRPAIDKALSVLDGASFELDRPDPNHPKKKSIWLHVEKIRTEGRTGVPLLRLDGTVVRGSIRAKVIGDVIVAVLLDPQKEGEAHLQLRLRSLKPTILFGGLSIRLWGLIHDIVELGVSQKFHSLDPKLNELPIQLMKLQSYRQDAKSQSFEKNQNFLHYKYQIDTPAIDISANQIIQTFFLDNGLYLYVRFASTPSPEPIPPPTPAPPGHASKKDIQDAKARISAEEIKLQKLSEPDRIEGTDARVSVNRSMFDSINAKVHGMPESERTARLKLISAEGTIDSPKHSHSGLPLGCGWELKLHRLSGNADVTLSDVSWQDPGILNATVHAKSTDLEGNVGVHVNGVPCPDISCRIAHVERTIRICADTFGFLCWNVRISVPYPECEFHGWNRCDDCTIGGGFEVIPTGFRANFDSNVSATLTPSILPPEDHSVVRLIEAHPRISPAAIASELLLPPATVQASIARLHRFELLDDAMRPTDSGKEFANGLGSAIGMEESHSPPSIPLHMWFKIRLPGPPMGLDFLCQNFGDQIREVCNAESWLKDLMPAPVMKILQPLQFEINLDDLITMYNFGPGIFHPIDYPAIDLPRLMPPDAIPLSGRSDEQIPNPVGLPSGSFKLPTSDRPIRTEGFASKVDINKAGVAANGSSDTGWTDIENWQDDLMVHFVDVGQGDAIWIKLPRNISGAVGDSIIIDGGPDSDQGGMYAEYNRLLLYLQFYGLGQDGNVHTVIVTHPHRDHYIGLIGLLENLKVRTLVISGRHSLSADYHRLLNVARKHGVQIVDASKNLFTNIMDRVKVEILYALPPGAKRFGIFETRTSNASVVTKLTYGDHSFLFLGDALGRKRGSEPRYVEADLMRTLDASVLRSTIMKLGDHGSSRVGSTDFLKATNPSVVVVSSGHKRRRFRILPNPATMQRIHNVLPGTTLLTTALEALKSKYDYDAADILVGTDGHKMYVYQALAEPGATKRKFKLVREIP